jgi:ribulose-phosphate 3-epimerase
VVAGSAVYGGSPVDNIAALRAAAATVALTS